MTGLELNFRAKLALLAILILLALAALGSPRLQSEAKDALAFAVIGDTGTGGVAQFEVARQMKIAREQTPYDFVLMLGDNIYPDGDPIWFKSRFEEPYRELLQSGVKFYATLGNHDVRKGAEAALRYDNFNMGGRRYYSFTKADGLIEFFALDSTAMTSAQTAWLEEQLKSSKARWKTGFFHHPIYSSARTHGSDLKLRALLEPLFVRYGVDVVFAGHDHVYERIKPQQGVSYFISGASGQLRRGDLDRRSKFHEAGNDRINSFLLVQVEKSGMRIKAMGSDGASLDTVALGKK